MQTAVERETGSEALSAGQAARFCGVSERHWWSMNTRGLNPRPIRLGASVRWLRAELAAWLASGAPTRERWEAERKGGAR